jgi:hypothetical protein
MLSRRLLLSSFPAAAVLLTGSVEGAEVCSKHGNNGETCSAGVVIGNMETARQRCGMWCWAACIETVFALHGYKVEQEDVVKKIFGTADCSPGTTEQIIAGIGGVWSNKAGSSFRASAYSLPDTILSAGTPKPSDKILGNSGDREVIAELSQGNPLIIGSRGQGPVAHATVLTAVKYEKYFGTPIWINEIIIRDPWPGSPNRRVLTASEYAGTFSIIKVSVSATWLSGAALESA